MITQVLFNVVVKPFAAGIEQVLWAVFAAPKLLGYLFKPRNLEIKSSLTEWQMDQI